MDDRLLALLDKRDIEATLMRFARGIDRLDTDLIHSAFHPDATDDHGPFKGSADDFVRWAIPILSSFHVSQHEISNIQIDLHGDRANVETYLMALHIVGTPPVEETVFGRYLDMFEKRDGAWKIAKRLVVVDYSSTRDSARPYSAQDDYVRFRRDKTDPVYTFHKTAAAAQTIKN